MFDEDDEPDNTSKVMNKYYWRAFLDYIKDPTERKGKLDVSEHALTFWKNESARQPHLALMARDILAVPATSVDVERLFSQARNLISYNRHRLDRQIISDTMFLRGAETRKRRTLGEADVDDFHQWCEPESALEDRAVRQAREISNPIHTEHLDVMESAFSG